MGARMCSNCMELFEFDDNDIRPFIYHECGDGSITGIRNPNFWGKKIRQWIPPPKTKEQVINRRLKEFYGKT